MRFRVSRFLQFSGQPACGMPFAKFTAGAISARHNVALLFAKSLFAKIKTVDDQVSAQHFQVGLAFRAWQSVLLPTPIGLRVGALEG